jgi:hypothetical protein
VKKKSRIIRSTFVLCTFQETYRSLYPCRYVDQYQALLAAPSGLEGIEKADLEYYEAVVASCSGVDLDEPYLPPSYLEDDANGGDTPAALLTASSLTVDVERYNLHIKEKAELEELYAGYVRKPERLAQIGTRGGSLTDPYERWLKGFDS